MALQLIGISHGANKVTPKSRPHAHQARNQCTSPTTACSCANGGKGTYSSTVTVAKVSRLFGSTAYGSGTLLKPCHMTTMTLTHNLQHQWYNSPATSLESTNLQLVQS